MYKSILKALSVISKADKAELRRCSLKTLANSPAYFRVLAYSKATDSKQTQRILFLFLIHHSPLFSHLVSSYVL